MPPRWRWLVCTAWFVPAAFLAAALPALVTALYAAYFTSAPIEWSLRGFRVGVQTGLDWGPWQQLTLHLALLAAMYLISRRAPVAGSFLMLVFGWNLLPIIPILFRRAVPPAAVWIPAMAAIPALVLAFRELPARVGIAGYKRRLLFLAAGFALPAVATSLLQRPGPRFALWPELAASLAVCAAGAAIARTDRTAGRWRWWFAGMGLVATLATYSGVELARQIREERRRAATESTLREIRTAPQRSEYDRLFFQRGVSFTAEAGVRYDSATALGMLEKLPGFGVNSIAVVPFGGVRDSPIRITPAGRGSWESDDGVRIVAARARKLGLRVMLKPHIWRQWDIKIESEAVRAEWFAQMRGFVEHYARLAQEIGADIFCIGTELPMFTRYEKEWRELAAAARAIYPGPITYAANHGPEFESIAFWDALDYIGIDNYYPLPDDFSTAQVMERIEKVHKRFDRPVLFTEVGFPATVGGHREPWADENGKPISLETQAKGYQALLDAFYDKPWFFGAYWWKVGTNGYGGAANASMTPWRKPAMDVVKRFYTSGRR